MEQLSENISNSQLAKTVLAIGTHYIPEVIDNAEIKKKS